jgi:1-acyl-sn-glycerol-3-phosphate acyltransferase
MLHTDGPLLLAANHPNSFLDAVILDLLFKQPVWSLARGDAFRNKQFASLLEACKILPVYRSSEGVENISENYKTFDSCMKIFRNQGTIQIFSEGKCINEWHLRPLKKGTARLAIKAWEEGIPLKILPVGINYSSFSLFGKNIFLNLGDIIQKNDIDLNEPDGIRHQAFNNLLQQQLEKLVWEIPANDKKLKKQKLYIQQPLYKKLILFIPALAGLVVHAPLYLLIKWNIWKKTAHNDHYDSVMTTILIFTYPLYLLVITVFTGIYLGIAWALAIFLLFPFTAWAYIQLKRQLD